MLVKCIAFPVTYQETENMSYADFCKAMFQIQRKVRELKNNVATDYYLRQRENQRVKEETGEYPKFSTTKFSNEEYHKYKALLPEFNTANLNQIIYSQIPVLKSHWPDVLKGDRSVDSYKKNQPIVIKGRNVRLRKDGGDYHFDLSVFSKAGVKEYGLDSGIVTMKAGTHNPGIKKILDRCVLKDYAVCTSSLGYNTKKRKWELSVTYKFEKAEVDSALSDQKVLGLDLGVNKAYVAATNFSYDHFSDLGKDIWEKRARVEGKRRAMKIQRGYCGSGSIGHGYATRVKPVLKIGDEIAQYRKWRNHQMSRRIVDQAVALGCGVIQMENLTGISESHKFLKSWSYYDLQMMIQSKAAEAGIEVRKINPKYTSRRCSKCGYIHEENRHGEEFECLACGYKTDADLNAARNIAVPGIDKIIQKAVGEPQDNRISA